MTELTDDTAKGNPSNPLAFPAHESMMGAHPDWLGMTLRDWFAGQIIAKILDAGLIVGPAEPNDNNRAARIAYALADAMLAARGGA